MPAPIPLSPVSCQRVVVLKLRGECKLERMMSTMPRATCRRTPCVSDSVRVLVVDRRLAPKRPQRCTILDHVIHVRPALFGAREGRTQLLFLRSKTQVYVGSIVVERTDTDQAAPSHTRPSCPSRYGCQGGSGPRRGRDQICNIGI